MLKQLIAELTRGGCHIERLAYDPPAITFRSPGGNRLALTTDRRTFQLCAAAEHQRTASAQFGSVHEVVRAACLS